MENYPTSEAKANREHKSSVFTELFSDKDKLLELYNAIKGKNYSKDTEMEIITLSGVMFTKQQNDIAFVMDNKLVVLIEHQSTINENMPLRMYMYIAREYEMITNRKDLYRKSLVKIPTPELIVLYNGDEEYPDFKELRLSDAFKLKIEPPFIELLVHVYNINKGRNAEIAKRSQSLSDYSEFIAEVKKNREAMKNDEAAITEAIKTCLSKNIFVDFLKKHGSEVVNMLFGEYDHNVALEVAKEEGILEVAENMLKDGLDLTLIARYTKLPEKEILALM